MRRSTASSSPRRTASTLPSRRLRTQPLTPRRNASVRNASRNPTPWTRPLSRIRRVLTSVLGAHVKLPPEPEQSKKTGDWEMRIGLLIVAGGRVGGGGGG